MLPCMLSLLPTPFPLQQACGSAHHMTTCTLLHLQPLRGPCWLQLPHPGCADGMQGQTSACSSLANLLAEEVVLVLGCRGKQLQAQQETEARKYKKDRSALTVKVCPSSFARCRV